MLFIAFFTLKAYYYIKERMIDMSDLGNREVMAANIKYFMTLHGKSRKQI